MPKKPEMSEKLFTSLQERAKELNCLYDVEAALRQLELPPQDAFLQVVRAMPAGFQYPDICRAMIECEGSCCRSEMFDATPWVLKADIVVQNEVVGQVSIFYLEDLPPEDQGPFLAEEVRLIQTIASRLGHYVLYRRLHEMRAQLRPVTDVPDRDRIELWRGPVRLLRQSDRNLYVRIARRMINHLCRIGIAEAQPLLPGEVYAEEQVADASGDANVPRQRLSSDANIHLSDHPFELASKHLPDKEILDLIQRWLQEDKVGGFLATLNNPRSSVPEIADAVHRYHHGLSEPSDLPISSRKSMRVLLTQRLLTEQLDFVRVAKDHVETTDFQELVDRLIHPPDSHGRLGGKGAGLILAHKIIARAPSAEHPMGDVKVPKTWYVASDALLDFVAHNDLQDIIQQKFKEIDQVRQEYPNVIQLFKELAFPRLSRSGSVPGVG